jgi:hypothetical protein
MKTTPAPVRFWRKVDTSGGPDACWPWMGGRKAKGYGNFFLRREQADTGTRMVFVNAHKFAYLEKNGAIPDGLVVRHTCDNPPCCNPKHLIPGTPRQNTADGIGKGRITIHARGTADRRKSGLLIAAKLRKLTDDDVRSICREVAAGTPQLRLAERHGVSPATICRIVAGKKYQWVERP